MVPEIKILFMVTVPDGSPEMATPLQGFAPSICEHFWLLRGLFNVPSDILEMSITDADTKIARRMSGEAQIWWALQSPSAVNKLSCDEHTPFSVVMVSPKDDARQYLRLKQCLAPPLIVAEAYGDIDFKQFNSDRLHVHLRDIVERVKPKWPPEVSAEIESILAARAEMAERDIGYKIGGHNAFTPNMMALLVGGYKEFTDDRFFPKEQGIAPFVKGIVQTATSVLDERDRVGAREMNRIRPIRPALTLFAPSIYSQYRDGAGPKNEDAKERKATLRAIQAIQAQTGYRFEFPVEKAAKMGLDFSGENPSVNPVFTLRQHELHLQTNAVGLLAASEFSAVIRMPNGINRTAGQIKQFAAQRRGADNSERKRIKAFRNVQKTIGDAFPSDFIPLLRRAGAGVRIISDAPLEWLDLDGVPLGIAMNCSRIPTTPGNSLMGELASRAQVSMKVKALEEILVINAIKQDDPIYPYFVKAFASYEGVLADKISIKQVEVSSRKELVEAINSFDGAFMVFNGHGSHYADEPAYLWLKDEKVDVWSLREQIPHVPPLILLSACDTHAADRNHATTASGFLSLGASSVLATFLPIPALDAAVFAARLSHRIAEYVPAAIKSFNRGVSWMEVVGGMLRMTLARDYLERLEDLKLIDHAAYRRLHMKANAAINMEGANPFPELIQGAIEVGVLKEKAEAEFRAAIASSTAISYVQLGRPEAIVFDSEERIVEQVNNIDNLV